MTLDLDAARRQTLATSYRQEDVDRLLAGRLRMAPHPEWQLPDSPTWTEDPFQDRNWQFQFHMLRWLEPLRRAAAKGDDEAFGMWLRWVEDWVAANPPRAPRSAWAWTDMSDGIRAQQLCLAAPMLEKRRPDLLPWLEDTIRIHADHLADPRKMGNANHALHQQESLFVCGRVLQEDRLWKLASDRMSSLLHEQYDEQGMNAEGATAYHYNNYLWWERSLERFDLEGVPRPHGANRHLYAPVEIAHATRPDGTLVPIGDTDTVDPRAIGHPAIDYVTTDGQSGTAPVETIAIYDAGLVLARSGWGDDRRPFSEQSFYSVRFGPSRRVHGHPDGGSVTYSAHRTHWVTDLGKYQYGSSTARDHVASRGAHSLVSIEGKKPRKDARVTLERHEITSTHHDLEFADDSFRGVTLTRRMVYSVEGEYLVVLDSIRSRLPVTATQRWQLGPDVSVRRHTAGADLTSEHGTGILYSLLGTNEVTSARGQDSPFDGWVSTAWKTTVPAAALTFRQTGSTVRFLTVLAASGTTSPNARLLTSDEATDSFELVVGVSNHREQIRISPGRAVVEAAPSIG